MKRPNRHVKVFVISDTHFPFENKQAYNKMLLAIKQEKPTHVVQIGDLLDQYVFSRYSKSAEITPKFEVSVGIQAAQVMWTVIQRLVPKAKCYQLMGNHDMRLGKRIMERLPELEGLLDKGVYSFPGVKTLKSDRESITIDGVMYVHGWLSKSIDHAKHFNMPTVHGHRHRPCIEIDRPGLWSMDVGFLGDEKSLPLSYTQNKLTKWTLACGVVENRKPRLILL